MLGRYYSPEEAGARRPTLTDWTAVYRSVDARLAATEGSELCKRSSLLLAYAAFLRPHRGVHRPAALLNRPSAKVRIKSS